MDSPKATAGGGASERDPGPAQATSVTAARRMRNRALPRLLEHIVDSSRAIASGEEPNRGIGAVIIQARSKHAAPAARAA
jgi:hypothetical protein